MYETLRDKIEEALKGSTPDAVLFSGGVDSSAVLYEAKKMNPNVKGITVAVEGKESSDLEYSRLVANELGIDLEVCKVSPEQVKSMVEEAVKVLKSFNPEWISSTTTLLIGAKYAKEQFAKSISSGEGADDIFGSFPFFQNWNNSMPLDKAIEIRLKEIVVMSEEISKYLEMTYITPFHNEKVVEHVLNIPIGERMKTEGDIKTKYPLRKAYEGILPAECIIRPQTMAFKGSGIYDTIRSIGDDISDGEFNKARKKYFNFRNKFEYALFKMYTKHYLFEQVREGGCAHCGSGMNGHTMSCPVCATLQVEGKELSFSGNNPKEDIIGAEGLVLQGQNIILGVQANKRWKKLLNGKYVAAAKTIGGQMEPEDEGDTAQTLLREIVEEIEGININKIKIRKLCRIKSKLNQLNPFYNDELTLEADFFIVKIPEGEINPNDIPVLFKIPVTNLIDLPKREGINISFLKKYAICKEGVQLPDNVVLILPEELEKILCEINRTLKKKSEQPTNNGRE